MWPCRIAVPHAANFVLVSNGFGAQYCVGNVSKTI
jgi:hypothetical protein